MVDIPAIILAIASLVTAVTGLVVGIIAAKRSTANRGRIEKIENGGPYVHEPPGPEMTD